MNSLSPEVTAASSSVDVPKRYFKRYADINAVNNKNIPFFISYVDYLFADVVLGRHFVILMEIKSTHDSSTNIKNLEITSDSKVIKNNKRSAQHQLRDHMEILSNILGINPKENRIQSYIMWPFLGALTRDPKQQLMARWKEDGNLHVFENILQSQMEFDKWFLTVALKSNPISEETFTALINR